jgi:hypothetical protein
VIDGSGLSPFSAAASPSSLAVGRGDCVEADASPPPSGRNRLFAPPSVAFRVDAQHSRRRWETELLKSELAVCHYQSRLGWASCGSNHVRNAPLSTVGPKKAACRDGPKRSFTQQRYTYSALPHCDSSNAHPAALKMGEK